MGKNEKEGNKLGDGAVNESKQITEESIAPKSIDEQDKEIKEVVVESNDDDKNIILSSESSDQTTGANEEETDVEESNQVPPSEIHKVKEDEEEPIAITSEESPELLVPEITITNTEKDEDEKKDETSEVHNEIANTSDKEEASIEKSENKKTKEEGVVVSAKEQNTDEPKEITSEDTQVVDEEPKKVITDDKKGEEEKVINETPVAQNIMANTSDTEDSTVEKSENKESDKEDIDVSEKAEDTEGNHEDSEGKENVEEHHFDYTNYTKQQMVQVLESLLKEDDYSQVGRVLKEIKKPYDHIANSEQKEAYNRFIEDGGEKDGFEYRPDELDQRFLLAFNKLKERRSQYFNSLEKQKEQNLNLKLEILEKLRALVDSEETGASIKELKDIQKQWKEVGVIPVSQAKSLWANFSALLDRFYDQRSIYYELKELDRKKNHDLKIELCEKAEALSEEENIREAIKQLNELHDEFKHIGPVPKDDQEAIWNRFKVASDKIYTKRKEYYEKLKGELKLNEVAKEALVEKVIPFADYHSDKISNWNAKTKELLAIQKEWDAIGSLPKEKAKTINKKFWSSFKSFFSKKGQFFKAIEGKRQENLALKKELVQKAELLKDSEDFRKTSEELKQLQKEWKDIGPVPEKYRNEVFMTFKKACDHFFNRRRANSGKVEKDYEENLKKKQSLCEQLEEMIESKKIDPDNIKSIEKEWSEIGFVPKSNIRSIQKRYSDAIGKLVDNMDVPDSEKHKLRFSAQFGGLNYGPGTEKLIQKKEGALRRQISNLENDINLWKNNIDFFAASKNADKLKSEFQVKIDKASEQLNGLKEQLKAISNI